MTTPTLEYRTIDKSAWGEGPWQSEPDKRQWQDEATGYPCLIVRGPVGALCGYVGVAPGHPLYKRDYNDPEVEVHGGLTFADGCGHGPDPAKGICHIPGEGEPDHVWWFGFDCSHCDDYAPGCDYRRMDDPVLGLGAPTGWGTTVQYRDLGYVEAQVAALAKQLAALARADQ